MITGKQVKIEKLSNGDFLAHAHSAKGYGRTEKEALQRLANNLSFYGIGHAL